MVYNIPMVRLIFALGNPSKEYESTRHNVGFMALDAIRADKQLPEFQEKSKFKAEISEFSYDGEKIILAKPTTFYNLTGESARALVDFYQIEPQNVLVIHDELALDFGRLRVRDSGSDAGNKGIRSIISHLGSDFWRLRIGTNSDRPSQIETSDFVLSKFSEQEKKTLKGQIFPKVYEIVDNFLDNSLEPTSTSAS